MSHPLFNLLQLLDWERLSYRLDRCRPDTILVVVTLVGERLEIDVSEDGTVEFSRFRGDESVDNNAARLEDIIMQQ